MKLDEFISILKRETDHFENHCRNEYPEMSVDAEDQPMDLGEWFEQFDAYVDMINFDKE